MSNHSNYGGGGILLFYGGASIVNNQIMLNWSLFAGGGLYAKFGGGSYLERNIVAINEAQYGGGIYLEGHSGVEIVNCTVSHNTADYWGGGLHISTFCYPEVLNSIVWGNAALQYDDIFVAASDSVTFEYSDIPGGWLGTGNINADPMFIDPEEGNFSLTWDNYPIEDSTKSPCIDAGNPEQEYNDPDGTRNDMGALYFNQFPLEITDLTISVFGDGILLNWSGVEEAVSYMIYQSDDAYFVPAGIPLATVYPPQTEFFSEGALREGKKFYRVVFIY